VARVAGLFEDEAADLDLGLMNWTTLDGPGCRGEWNKDVRGAEAKSGAVASRQ